jgi:hypothetical protein
MIVTVLLVVLAMALVAFGLVGTLTYLFLEMVQACRGWFKGKLFHG